MNMLELKSKYDDLLKDRHFDELDLGLKNPNIFQVLRISKTEIRHSNFLSWLLDPNQSHKLGDIFLKRFLREVFSSELFSDINQVDVEGMDLHSLKIFREWKNLDLLIELPNVVVCIENKVDSKEHSNQLERYRNIVNDHFPDHKKTFVYLTPDGSIPENENFIYEPISYEFIVDTLERITSTHRDFVNKKVISYIDDYIEIVKREFMKNDELTMLSQKIYHNHRDILDFIYKSKPDVVDNLKRILIAEISQRGWIEGSRSSGKFVRFLTPKLKNLIYYNRKIKNGWKKNETFLFEIVCERSTNVLIFRTVISASDANYNNERIEQLLLEINGFNPSESRKWLVNYSEKVELSYEEDPSMEGEIIQGIVKSFFDKITPVVEVVGQKFLENETEILKMKSVNL